jgi:hypothetical protein
MITLDAAANSAEMALYLRERWWVPGDSNPEPAD